MTIGVITPLSPPGDPSAGLEISRGVNLAVDYVNNNGGVLGGRKIQVKILDSKGTPDLGVSAYRTLVEKDKAVFVTGFFHSSVQLAVNEVAKQIGVPTMGTATSAADVTAKHYDISFRSNVLDPDRAAMWVQWIKDKKFKRVAVMAEDTDYGTGLVDVLKKLAPDVPGLELMPVVFDHTAVDFSAQLLKIKAWKPDLLINIGTGQPADAILDEASTIGLYPNTPMLYSYEYPTNPQFWKTHPKDGVGVYFSGYPVTGSLSAAGKWFRNAYQKKYSEAPTFNPYSAFGCVLVIAEAVDQAGSTKPDALVHALETQKFETWYGRKATYAKAEGAEWHNASPGQVIAQFTKANQPRSNAKIVFESNK